MSNQVAVIQITKNGSDKAVFLNGEFIISADPGYGDSVETIEQVAYALAGILGTQVDCQWQPESVLVPAV
jgi:hypothetical protein